MQEVQKKLLLAYDDLKEKAANAELEVKLREEERDQALRKVLKYKKVLESMKNEKLELEKASKDVSDLTQERKDLTEKCVQLSDALEDALNEVGSSLKKTEENKNLVTTR